MVSADSHSSSGDLLPDKHDYFTYLKKVFRHRCRQGGFRRITTAITEDMDSCQTVFGKAMDTCGFEVKSSEAGKKILRFDPVFSTARAYVTHDMSGWPQPIELYYIESFFQKDEQGHLLDRPEFGVQILGNCDPALDAQVVYLAFRILRDLGLHEHYSLQINHIGSIASRETYLEDLKNFYFDKERSLCSACVGKNQSGQYLELLRCREEDCAILAQLAPKLENYLTEEDRSRYHLFKEFLDELQIPYVENKSVVGTGSYNSNTVFEFWHNNKGSQGMIIHGGSNDQMIAKLGAPSANILGFSTDIRLLIQNMNEAGITVPHKDHLQVFVAQLGKNAKKKALFLLEKLREVGIQAVGAVGTGSMRDQLDMASELGAKFTLLMGEIEVREGMIIIRDMSVGSQESVPYDKVVEIMQERIGKEKMDVMEEEEISKDLKRKKK
ncbi:MAG: HisS family protein [bacterium]|nr:HisS family protein [bacterium]